MTRDKIEIDRIYEASNIEPYDFPKYTTQLLNLANQNSQATRPRVVGQMSELIKEADPETFNEWKNWYLNRHPDAIQKAKAKIKDQIEKLRRVIDLIDDEMIEAWLKDLILVKTAEGLLIQKAVFEHLSAKTGLSHDVATPEEESVGIDGYLGGIPVSIKPESYKQKTSTKHEEIDAVLVFYKKTERYLHVTYNEEAIPSQD